MVYADDVQIYTTVTTDELPAALCKIEECITAIQVWLTANFLVLNSKKTEFIVIGTAPQIKKLTCTKIVVGGESIQNRNPVRDLGVWLDTTLSWEPHIKRICASAFQHMRLIHRMRKSLSLRNRYMAVHSLVLSRLDFSAPLLLGLSTKLTSKLQLVINSAMRSILRLQKYDSVSQQLLANGWLSATHRIQYRSLLLLASVLSNSSPKYLSDKIMRHERPSATSEATPRHIF
jgi:hypothetical protein